MSPLKLRPKHLLAILGVGSFILSAGCTQGAGGGGNGAGDGGNDTGGGGNGSSNTHASGTTFPAEPIGEWNVSVITKEVAFLMGIPDPPPITEAAACGVLLPVIEPVETELASAGSCRVVTVEPPSQPAWFPNAGKVTMSGPEFGKHPLQMPDDSGGCMTKSLEQAFAKDEVVTIAASGGDDVPPFSLETVAPWYFTVHVSHYFSPGEPYDITFEDDSTGLDVRVDFLSDPAATFIRCAPDGASALTIDGSLTAFVPADATLVVVSALRTVQTEAVQGAATVKATIGRKQAFTPTVL